MSHFYRHLPTLVYYTLLSFICQVFMVRKYKATKTSLLGKNPKYIKKNNGNGRTLNSSLYDNNGVKKHNPIYYKKRYAIPEIKQQIRNWEKLLAKTPIPAKIRKEIFERDNYKCQICGQKEFLGIHHGDKNRKNNDYWNLLTVCPGCHKSIHHGMF